VTTTNDGRAPSGQALAVPVEPVSRLDPSGFDPSRYVTGADAAALWPDREHRLYYPCALGVHLCGANHEDNYFYTIGNFPCATEEEATTLWLAMKAECEVEREAADFLVDRNGVDGHDDDFWSNRQMLARIDAIAMEARQGTDPQGLDGEAATARVRQDIAQNGSGGVK
jgi:hypothetical protein